MSSGIVNIVTTAEMKSSSTPAFSGMTSLSQSHDIMKSEFLTVTSLVQVTRLSASSTENLMQSQAATTSLVHAGISTTNGIGFSSSMQSVITMQSQTGSTSVTPASTSTVSDVSSKIQSGHSVLSQAQTTGVSGGAESMSLPPTGTTVILSESYPLSTLTPDVMQSYVRTTSMAHTSISESVLLLSSLQVPSPSTILTSQSASSQLTPSAQFPVVSSEIKGGLSTLHLSASQSLGVVSTTHRSLLSSTSVKPLPSISSFVVPYVTPSLSATPSG